MAGFVRVKRVTDPLGDEVRARLVGRVLSGSSSGSEHSSDGNYGDDDSPCLSELVQGFLEGGTEAETRWCGGETDSDSDSGSERVGSAAECGGDSAEEIARAVSTSLASDPYGRLLLSHVLKAMELLMSRSRQVEDEAVLRRKAMTFLRDLGHNAAICKTKWSSSGGLSAGSYEFIDVVAALPQQHRGAATSLQTVRYFLDLDFASRFEIARPTKEYTRALQSLPRVFVGRGEDLKRIVKSTCDAARRSLRSRGLTLPPWRKNRYMQTKWFGPYRRTTNSTPSKPPINAVKCRSVGFDNAVNGRLFVRTN